MDSFVFFLSFANTKLYETGHCFARFRSFRESEKNTKKAFRVVSRNSVSSCFAKQCFVSYFRTFSFKFCTFSSSFVPSNRHTHPLLPPPPHSYTFTHTYQLPHTLIKHTHQTHSSNKHSPHTLTTHTHHSHSPHTLTTHTNHTHTLTTNTLTTNTHTHTHPHHTHIHTPTHSPHTHSTQHMHH